MTPRPRDPVTPRLRDLKDRRGFALLLTLLVLAVLSTLLAGGFFLARIELATGRGVGASTRALLRAEQGIDAVLSPWTPRYDSLPFLVDTVLASGPSGPGLLERRTLTRLMERLFTVRSEAIVTGPAGDTLARREVAVFVRTPVLQPDARAALSVADSVALAAGSRVSGVDTIPAWPGCGPPDSSVAALLSRDSTLVSGLPCPGCLQGTPSVLADSAFTSAALAQVGMVGMGQLARRADLVARGTVTPAPVSGASCLVSASGNWGDPAGGVCGGWYPVIHAPGSLTMAGGVGQGVLLVDGDLTLRGGAVFAGLALVRGRLLAGTGGGMVLGAVRAGSADLRASSGVLKIAYSTCVLRRVMGSATRPMPLPGHWWIEVP